MFLTVLTSTDDVVHPLLFACETKNLVIVKIGLSSLQKLIQYNTIPQVRVHVHVHVHHRANCTDNNIL